MVKKVWGILLTVSGLGFAGLGIAHLVIASMTSSALGSYGSYASGATDAQSGMGATLLVIGLILGGLGTILLVKKKKTEEKK